MIWSVPSFKKAFSFPLHGALDKDISGLNSLGLACVLSVQLGNGSH